jgi:hypothetical protein
MGMVFGHRLRTTAGLRQLAPLLKFVDFRLPAHAE